MTHLRAALERLLRRYSVTDRRAASERYSVTERRATRKPGPRFHLVVDHGASP